MIEVLEIRNSAKFPIIEFKFLNNGNGTALLRKFVVSVLEFRVDYTPVIRPYVTMNNRDLIINIKNDGWGPAYCQNIKLSSPYQRLFPSVVPLQAQSIKSGQDVTGLIMLSCNNLDRSEYLNLLHSKGTELDKEYRSFRDIQDKKVLFIDPPVIDIEFQDIANNHFSVSLPSSTERLGGNAGGGLRLCQKGFEWYADIVMFCKSLPSAIYYISIEEDQLKKQREYSITHTIPSGEAEYFSIMVGSSKSCELEIQLEFIIDSNTVIKSDKFCIKIWNPMNEHNHSRLVNGDELISRKLLENSTSKFDYFEVQRDNFKRLQFRDSSFPFIRNGKSPDGLFRLTDR